MDGKEWNEKKKKKGKGKTRRKKIISSQNIPLKMNFLFRMLTEQ